MKSAQQRQKCGCHESGLIGRGCCDGSSRAIKNERSPEHTFYRIGASASLLNGIGQDTASSNTANNAQDLAQLLKTIENSPSNMTDIQSGQANYTKEIQDITKTDQDLANLQDKLNQFKQISPVISVSPFVSETSSINPVTITPLDFFAPGVIVLLLQHIAVTIASLSIVRERRSGTMELFRVSPISAGEVFDRKIGHALAKGVPGRQVMAELWGKATGCSAGRGGSMQHVRSGCGFMGTNGIVGSGITMSAGGALSAQLRKSGQVTVCFFGDGASNSGSFYEGLNLASIWNLPVVYVCENQSLRHGNVA